VAIAAHKNYPKVIVEWFRHIEQSGPGRQRSINYRTLQSGSLHQEGHGRRPPTAFAAGPKSGVLSKTTRSSAPTWSEP